MEKSVVRILIGISLLAFHTANLPAQVVKEIHFSPSEGYTNGPLWGQPSGSAMVWTCVSDNRGNSWTNEDGTPWIVQTVTNGAMHLWPDQNFGTNRSGTMYWAIPIPAQKAGPVTVTWDWQFFPTNEIPADYDPTNNNYNALLQGTDHGFTLSDSNNRLLGDDPVFAVFNELSTPTRMGSLCDSRYNFSYGACDGGGNWNGSYPPTGPEFKDGKKLRLKLVAYFGDETSPTNNSFDVWAQREGEEVWRETLNDSFPDGPYPMRRCPTPENGIDCITMWLNGGAYSTHIEVSNIVVVGRVPVVRIERSGAVVKVTYTGTLQAAQSSGGPFKDLVGPVDFMAPFSTLEVPATTAATFYRARY